LSEIRDGVLQDVLILWHLTLKDVSREEALEILEEIEENVGVCCAITMEPDEVLVLIDKLKSYLENEV
jgi:3-deoxy-D-arabino-heptulosonate 7-phosphate (DAHP) synthase class II